MAFWLHILEWEGKTSANCWSLLYQDVECIESQISTHFLDVKFHGGKMLQPGDNICNSVISIQEAQKNKRGVS